MTPEPSADRARPTRTEQRAATRAALLDAAITSLLENGYVATTTRDVAERAGVSQGAQQHYFPTKASLVNAAFSRWFEQLAVKILSESPPTGSERERVKFLLDYLWDVHLPVVAPALDFASSERGNSDVEHSVSQTFNQLTHLVRNVAAALSPKIAQTPGFNQWLNMALAAIRGTVIFTDVSDIDRDLLDWTTLRTNLLRALDTLISDSDAPSSSAQGRAAKERNRNIKVD